MVNDSQYDNKISYKENQTSIDFKNINVFLKFHSNISFFLCKKKVKTKSCLLLPTTCGLIVDEHSKIIQQQSNKNRVSCGVM